MLVMKDILTVVVVGTKAVLADLSVMQYHNIIDIDECSDGLHCNTNIGNCTNTVGSYSCGCPDGYHVNDYRSTICNSKYWY